MAISINNGIANINGTPGAISGVFSDRPAAADVAEGTLYFATDTAAIYQTVSGVWVNYAAGGGGGSTGVNGLNGTANIGLGGTLNTNTVIDVDNFQLDFSNVKVFTVTSLLGNSLIIDDLFTRISNNGYGFLATNPISQMGDVFIGSGTILQIDNGSKTIQTVDNGNVNGLLFVYTSELYLFGSITNLNPQYFLIDGINGFTNFYSNGGIAINIDSINNIAAFGNVVAGTLITYVTFNNNGYEINGAGGNKLESVIGPTFSKTNMYNGNINYLFYTDNILSSSYFTLERENGVNPRIEFGIYANYDLGLYWYGDKLTTFNYLDINSTNGNILLLSQNNITLYQGSAGLSLQGGISLLCDPDGNGNSSFFGLDDNAEKLVGSTNLLATIGTPTTDRIKIELNGILYYIVLETA